MNRSNAEKQKILIVDDSEMNRSILGDMLGSEFEMLEAENGIQAVEMIRRLGAEISLVLLDIQMPEMDGFEVLALMNKYRWIDDIPVIMISAENSAAYMERAYDLGVTDYISRPFDARVVRRRAVNTIMLYVKQKKLVNLVADQIYEKEKSSSLMVSILSHIVEFRNGESGMHVLHIKVITEILLKQLVHKTDRYNLSAADISLISMASALHDIGKIGVSGEILNKPGRLTKEEFEIMKQHSELGAKMLDDLPQQQEEPLMKVAYAICRWHHERYDGSGYPDGRKGEEIPISAQVVSLADVYDALTSERVYKKAYSHEQALEMILNGECGAFNPLLLECLQECADVIRTELKLNSLGRQNMREMQNVVAAMMNQEGLKASDRTLSLLEYERKKYQFFASMSQEILFEYSIDPSVLTLSEWGARRLGVDEVIVNPWKNNILTRIMGEDDLNDLVRQIREIQSEDEIIQYSCELMIDGEPRWHRLICRSVWQGGEPPVYMGIIGKAADIHEEHSQLLDFERKISQDVLTGLLNHVSVKKKIRGILEEGQGRNFALLILDLDCFKAANDQYGHLFGDEVLKCMAGRLRGAIRSNDLAARIGGDEFLVFLEYKNSLEEIVKRIFDALQGAYESFLISTSMGIARTDGRSMSYKELFHEADQALYQSKRRGRKQYCFYDPSMSTTFSVISPIDGTSASE